MEQIQCINELMLFGLTRQEAQVYLCLLRNGALTGYEVAKQTGISRSNVYNALAGLVEQGAAYVAEGAASKYVAVAVGEFCENHISRMERTKAFLETHVPAAQCTEEGYLTVEGARNIHNKIRHMLENAAMRVYISAPMNLLEEFEEDLQRLLRRQIKLVVLAEHLPGKLEGAIFYPTVPQEGDTVQNQLRLIIDSLYVLTGDPEETCLYSDRKNFVNVFKEAMRNEIKLIEMRK